MLILIAYESLISYRVVINYSVLVIESSGVYVVLVLAYGRYGSACMHHEGSLIDDCGFIICSSLLHLYEPDGVSSAASVNCCAQLMM